MRSENVKTILRDSIKELRIILPIFFIATLFSVALDYYVPDELVQSLLNSNLAFSIPFATIIGILLPIPRYATYPLAFTLLTKGAGFGVIFALVAGEVICESIVRDLMEVKFLGLKFFITRLLVSVLFITLGGFLMEAIL